MPDLNPTESARKTYGPKSESADLSHFSIGIDARGLKYEGTGFSHYVQGIIADLAEAGARITLVTDEVSHQITLHARFPLLNVVALVYKNKLFWEQKALRKHLNSANYHAYIAPANDGLPLAYRGPTRLLLIIHDLIPIRLAHIYLLPHPKKAIKYFLSLGIAAMRADAIGTVSRATAQDVHRFLRRSNAGIVYPLIEVGDTGLIDNSDEDLTPSPVSFGEADRFLIYNGGPDPRKNVPLLLRSFACVHKEISADLIFIGLGYDNFLPLIRSLGIAEHVHLLGYVNEETKKELLRRAVAVVYPSRIEGFGLPVVEAMIEGTPIVTGTGGSLTEIGGPVPIYVRPLNRKTLAKAMIYATTPSARVDARDASRVQLELLLEHQRSSTISGITLKLIEEYSPSMSPGALR
jgi:glycosyltransferase involved in cell wall biosynthesis